MERRLVAGIVAGIKNPSAPEMPRANPIYRHPCIVLLCLRMHRWYALEADSDGLAAIRANSSDEAANTGQPADGVLS
eukprot:CAMPEP_0185252754 /NCGR_PEP_ID=MMETSP1359-20130426/1749_1 /TAXON_ID=552665 /ORGANISM="Bigelowiella longifila, Strain CCMP242" /LENGTH=76 /DNA_ID=CAMNT_0027834997 /DNA_START=401 /DNA_END=628 /DNA_ORIENTATION=-